MPPIVLPFQPAIGCVECRIYGVLFGQTVINHIDYKFGVGVEASQSEVAAIAGFVSTTWGENVLGQLSEDYTYIRTVATGLSTVQDWQFKSSIASGIGQISEPSLPGGNALRVNYDSGIRGPSAHWGTQVAGIPKNNYDGNNVAVDWAALLRISMMNLLVTDGVTGAPVAVNLQRTLNKIWLANANPFDIVDISFNTFRVGTQDTRMAGHGQ